jgi:hypothetical protein
VIWQPKSLTPAESSLSREPKKLLHAPQDLEVTVCPRNPIAAILKGFLKLGQGFLALREYRRHVVSHLWSGLKHVVECTPI